jgi:phage shock protein PspC (stress-responsive transcriptional regulator)
MGFQLLTKIYLPQSFLLLMIGAISAIGISLIITSRWKISIHMLGIGGVIGAIAGISQRFQFDHSILLIALILFAGLVGFARLKTKSHNYRQVYAGFILGVAVEWMVVLYF